MDKPALSIKNVSKFFDFKRSSHSQMKENKLTSLSDVSFDIEKGEIVGLIGLNGSGKTTLLRIISGIYEPDEGSVSIDASVEHR